MNIEIQSKLEASELCFALAARRSVLKARQRGGKTVYASQIKAVDRIWDQAKTAFRSFHQPQYRYLAVGEIVQAGDEIQRNSPYDNSHWVKVQATIGNPVRLDNAGEFRRRV
jgi:hypothetical protein